MRKFFRRLAWITGIFAVVLAILAYAFKKVVTLVEPDVSAFAWTDTLKRVQVSPNVWTCGDNWLRHNNEGLYELYVSGKPYELGYKNGLLTQDLVRYQEEVFVARIREMIPSDSYLKFLRYFLAWFNKDMDDQVPLPMRQEILGVSRSASHDFDFIAPPYHRILNYHGAHDIGHALQNLNLVACTAFGAWGQRTADSSMIIGRNFDFSMGDDFARDKIVAFYKPDKGHNFAFVTWGGLTGVVSGMNDKGLTVTLNSAKSAIPFSAKMPVSLLAREMLQYASTINEAYAIAQKHQTFVSESFLIGSAIDGKVAVIEKSADKIGLYDPGKQEIVLTNHFQSDVFKNDSLTIESRREGASEYRYKRVEELMGQYPRLDLPAFVTILRDRYGLEGKDIGMGNEKAINQLVAHHSIIFKPQQLQMWVSTNPYQLGKFVVYDLGKIFAGKADLSRPLNDTLLTVPADSFFVDGGFEKYLRFRELSKAIDDFKKESSLPQPDIEKFIALNPEYYHTYLVAGRYFYAAENYPKALAMFETGLSKVIPRLVDQEQLTEWKLKATEKLNEQN